MPIDETPNRIIIHDLDAELREIEAAEPPDYSTTLFPADIDKKVSAVPSYLLRGRTDNSNTNSNTQLVLYREPQSISVPESEDAVRKAVIAARKRMREKLAREREEQHAATKQSRMEETDITSETPPSWGNGMYYGHSSGAGYVDGAMGPSPNHYYMEKEDAPFDDPDAMDIG